MTLKDYLLMRAQGLDHDDTDAMECKLEEYIDGVEEEDGVYTEYDEYDEVIDAFEYMEENDDGYWYD